MEPAEPVYLSIKGLPGEGLLRQGLADAAAGRTTIPSCLAWIAWPKLSRAGLLDGSAQLMQEPERELYRLLLAEGSGDAFGKYNALLRELVSFERALEHRMRRSAESERKAE